MRVQLLSFSGCPNVGIARRMMARVVADFPKAFFEEVDVNAEATPPALRGWGSPTVLVDGKDVAGESPSGPSCRLYDDHHPQSRGVPSEEIIRRALGRPLASETLGGTT